jgi:hypothetical protein
LRSAHEPEPDGAGAGAAGATATPAFRRQVAIAVAVAGPLMVVYVLGYAATHPLRFDTHFGAGGKRVFDHEPGKLVRYTFRLANEGSADVTDLAGARAGGPARRRSGRALPLGFRA